ncbi:MAG: transglycosylase SLT domain-containing protein [Proteobacteria bacterium]|jgi:membrane-bound lytic murein transglycosylase D|nr:transglycosylase SLT domain-containing protein [Pseudomonadota bacterium]
MSLGKKISLLLFVSLALVAVIAFVFYKLDTQYHKAQNSSEEDPTELTGLEAKAAITDELTTLVLSDHKDLIPNEFESSPYFYPTVRFWFGIYTQFDSKQVVIHDKDSLGLVYSVLDFTKLNTAGVNRFAQSAIVQKIIRDKINSITLAYTQLSLGKTDSTLSQNILKLLRDHKLAIPSNALERKKFFEIRIENIRTQTGQRDAIAAGINRMMPFSVFLKGIFAEFNLPPQLTAIPFLESSFNNVAESKVGALGIWQFMPHIGNHFMPKRTDLADYRSNPFIASISALHLLKENHKILKSWDLAVTAYNSGTKHLVKARKELGINHLEEIFMQYNHPHIGFASKNFYAEFIALVATLAYRDEIFPAAEYDSIHDPARIKIGPAKCSFDLGKLKKNLPEKSWQRFKELNPHLLKPKALYPRGTIIVTDSLDTNYLVLALSPKQWRSHIPNRWAHAFLKKNHSCSTR